ncbi:MAG: hypothetical protein R6U63_08480 [Longimicrobiales bacterium]
MALLTVTTACDDGTSVTGERPAVTILEPSDGAMFPQSDTITFRGSAEDPEDGELTGDDLVWKSDFDGDLGTGREIMVSSLSSGRHLITLVATDSDDMKGTASITMLVEEPPR